MKILQTRSAPNPRRVRIFLAEKGVELPFEECDLMRGAPKTDAFTALNPLQRVPVLLFDDGSAIAESMAICRYFEETNPEPALFGRGARAEVEMWNRRMELELLFRVAQAFRHLHPAMAALEVPQVPAWGEANKPRAVQMLQVLDDQLRQHPFVAGAVFGRRYHGAGRHRFHEAGTHRAARCACQPGALVSGSRRAPQRGGVRACLGAPSRGERFAKIL